ncbi:adenylate/guanylate cyclase domain-containing protein [archaeon]|nr:MAG: adenylate/guanylate cyclase domain-containing protein [archaeon]
MITSDGKDQLLPFSKHVPSILVRQSICKIAERFMLKTADALGCSSEPPFEPSIERFYGALLFVDISGFTQLSSRMNVDDLRTHINAYFSLIINIVSKHGGEVVKFAGDALYVIWQINRDVLTVAGMLLYTPSACYCYFF